MNVYKEKGYRDRADYLKCMAADYDLAVEVVATLADLLGPNEDFDGLVCALEDAECYL